VRLDILDRSGKVVATRSGDGPQTLVTSLPAGTYTFRITGPIWSTMTTSISYLK
jgi:hypothetical protein